MGFRSWVSMSLGIASGIAFYSTVAMGFDLSALKFRPPSYSIEIRVAVTENRAEEPQTDSHVERPKSEGNIELELVELLPVENSEVLACSANEPDSE